MPRRAPTTSSPTAGISLSAMPGERGAADDRRDADHRARPRRRRRRARPGTDRIGPDRHHGVRRTEEHDVGTARSRRGRRARASPRSMPSNRTAFTGSSRVPLAPSTPGSAGRAARPSASITSIRVVTGSSVIGSTSARHAEQRSRDAPPSPPTASGPRASSCVRNTCVARSQIAEVEPGVDRRPTRASPPSRRTSRRPGPSPARGPSGRPASSSTESRSGETCRPWIVDVVAGVHDDRGQLAGERAVDPAEELPRPDPARERHDLHRGIA